MMTYFYMAETWLQVEKAVQFSLSQIWQRLGYVGPQRFGYNPQKLGYVNP
jgi:hypothetical protein